MKVPRNVIGYWWIGEELLTHLEVILYLCFVFGEIRKKCFIYSLSFRTTKNILTEGAKKEINGAGGLKMEDDTDYFFI